MCGRQVGGGLDRDSSAFMRTGQRSNALVHNTETGSYVINSFPASASMSQGRARPAMAQLYNWRYRALGDLPYVTQSPEYLTANAGLAFDYQFINVEDFMGRVRKCGIVWMRVWLGKQVERMQWGGLDFIRDLGASHLAKPYPLPSPPSLRRARASLPRTSPRTWARRSM